MMIVLYFATLDNSVISGLLQVIFEEKIQILLQEKNAILQKEVNINNSLDTERYFNAKSVYMCVIYN